MTKKIFAPHALAVSFLLCSGISWADEAASPATASFDIPPQNLEAALIRFSEQTDIQLVMASADVNGKEVDGVVGDLTHQEALTELLDDTGLEYRFVNDETVAIGVSDQGGDSDSKNLNRMPVLMAQNRTSQAPPTAGTRTTDDVYTGVVTGKVTDARTGANLKGAKISVEQTGEWTTTDNLGTFRLVNVPAGKVTLSVSYLGYAAQSAEIGVQGGPVSQDFALQGGDALEEIIVFGTRSSRALALNQERTAENSSTVISSDLLGNFTGTTISEALRRAPGVAFEQDFDTGDGTNIVIRGLAPDLNTVVFNGIELPEGTGEGRSAALNTILADSIESVTINKTLLPNQDSAGIGGLVEIETRSPLDRERRFFQFAAEGRQRDEDFLDDNLFSGIVSGRFGRRESLGLGLSVQYRDREIRSVTGGTANLRFGGYLPLDSEGGTSIRSASDVAPGNPFPFFDTPGAADVYPTTLSSNDTITRTETLSIGVNGAWDIADHSDLRFDYQLLDDTKSIVRTDYRIGTGSAYRARPVAARGGEVLNALTDFGSPARPTHSGVASADETNITHVFNLRGESSFRKFNLSYGIGYTSGEIEVPREFSFRGSGGASTWDSDLFIDRSAIDPVEGLVVSPFAPLRPEDEEIPIPRFTDAGFAVLNDPALTRRSSGSLRRTEGENTRFSTNFGARYEFGEKHLKYLEVGVDFEESEFFSFSEIRSIRTVPPSGALSLLGVEFDSPLLGGLGRDTGLRTWSTSTIGALYDSLDALAAGSVISIAEVEPNPLNIGVFAKETEYAPYVQARVEFGGLEIIGGFRYSIFEIEGNDLDFPRFTDEDGVRDLQFEEDNTVRRVERATQREFLPRVVVNYRHSDNLVFRGGYFRSIARPQLGLISNRRVVFLDLRPISGPNRDQPRLNINEGNEALEPAKTDNFDVSVEYYSDEIGVVKLSAFHKRIENLTESNSTVGADGLEGVTLPPFPTDFDIPGAVESGELFVTRFQPVNNPDTATIWGIELAAERQFTFLPGFWSGLGVYGNYTYTDSEKNQPIDYFNPATRENEEFLIDGVRFAGQPDHSGTAALTYNARNIDAALIYSAQSRRQTTFRANGLSSFAESFESLDFRFVYLLERFGGQYQLFFEATDLLRDFGEPTLLRGQGEDQIYYTNRSFLGGREFRIGLIGTF